MGNGAGVGAGVGEGNAGSGVGNAGAVFAGGAGTGGNAGEGVAGAGNMGGNGNAGGGGSVDAGGCGSGNGTLGVVAGGTGTGTTGATGEVAGGALGGTNVGGALGMGFAGITRGGSAVLPGNAGAVVPLFSPPGGVGRIGGGVAGVAGFVLVLVEAGILGPVGFFGPKMRPIKPGFLPESAASGLGDELATVPGVPVVAGVLSLSLSLSPKMRSKIGRFDFSFSLSFDASGIVAATGGSKGSLGRVLAFGGELSFALGCSAFFGGTSSTRSTSVKVSPVFVSFTSE
jgi:hypothetical protein